MDNRFVFRRAQAADETAVRALSALIWGGEDYVAETFHDWLADKTGQFTVVYERDTLVAFGKLSQLSPGEWWLEGLRVHPDQQGRGLARLLHDYALKLADEMGSGTLRFSTASTTPATHRLAETTGFTRTQVRLWAGVEQVEQHVSVEQPIATFVPIERGELTAVATKLSQSDQFAACGGLLEHDWKLWLILPRLAQLQAEQRLFWWSVGSGSNGLVIRTLSERSASLSYFQADPADWSHLLGDARRWLLATGAAEIRTKPPKSATVKAALLAAGWTVDEEFELWGYERPLR
ncbi:MAG: GNAT family N-acetyltransferase [Chloroflexota bacterium]